MTFKGFGDHTGRETVMTTASEAAGPPRVSMGPERFILPAVAAVGVAAAAILALKLGHAHPHAPDLALLARQPLAIKLHLLTAVFAFGLGAVQMAAPKGTMPHRTLGWIWVILIMTVAASSLFIRGLNHGSFSLIHLLSAWVLFIVPVGVWAARRHNVSGHRRAMMGTFYLGLIVAGAFTFIPGRLMWSLFF